MSGTTRYGRAFVRCALVSVVLLGGCLGSHVTEGAAPGMRVRSGVAPDAGIRMNSVGIIDDRLQSWEGSDATSRGKVAVERTDSLRSPSGTLEVFAVLRNRTDDSLQVEGRTLFFDAAQMEAEQASAWKRVYIAPNSIATYRESSLSLTGIAYYYIELREGP